MMYSSVAEDAFQDMIFHQ